MKLTFKQKQKKQRLFNEVNGSQKGKTRKQISNLWKGYRGKVYTIEYYPKYRSKIAGKKPEQKAEIRKKYFEKREIRTEILQYGNLKTEKTRRDKFTVQKWYKVRNEKKLDDTIEKLFSDKRHKTTYVMVILKVKHEKTGEVIFISDILRYSDFQDSPKPIINRVKEKFTLGLQYEGYILIDIHLRAINDIYKIPKG
jgi:hypothetical protein